MLRKNGVGTQILATACGSVTDAVGQNCARSRAAGGECEISLQNVSDTNARDGLLSIELRVVASLRQDVANPHTAAKRMSTKANDRQ
jgi:hypothetical protein